MYVAFLLAVNTIYVLSEMATFYGECQQFPEIALRFGP